MEQVIKTLNEVLNSLDFIRSYTDDISVLAECNLIEIRVKEVLDYVTTNK